MTFEEWLGNQIDERMEVYQEIGKECYDEGYQQGRADVLREHQEQCNGKCFKCEVGGRFIDSDGEEVILPYSYSYKTDCEDMRYIKATEVKFLLDKCRADAIEEFGNWLFENGYDSSSHNIKAWITEYNLRDKVAEELKEQKQ